VFAKTMIRCVYRCESMNNKRKHICLYLLVGILFAGRFRMVELAEAIQDTQSVELIISNVSLEKKAIDPTVEQGRITYKLSEDARVRVCLYDRDDFLVRIVTSKEQPSKGYNTVTIDGKDDRDRWLPPGAYTYVIEAESLDSNRKTSYDIKDESHGKMLTLRSLTYDDKAGKVEYVLPKAAMLRVRVGMKEGGPLLITPIDWQAQSAGRNQYIWDGNIGLSNVDFRTNPMIQLNLAAYSLPDNCIIIRYDKQPSKMASISALQQTEKRPSKAVSHAMHLHAIHPMHKCREPRFSMDFPSITEFTNDNVPIVSGNVPVRITVHDHDKKFLQDERFEIVFFVDFIFLYEEEDGISPATYFLKTAGMNEGKHFLTVNLYSFKDHIGTQTKAIYVKRATK